MTKDEIKQAHSLLGDLRRAEEALQNISQKRVSAIKIMAGGINDILLERGGHCGTGSISGLGYPPELEEAMTVAFHQFYEKRVEDAKAALKAMGVEE